MTEQGRGTGVLIRVDVFLCVIFKGKSVQGVDVDVRRRGWCEL